MAERCDEVIFFVLPAYNEQDNIKQLLSDISSYANRGQLDYHIVVSDDGSTDGTIEVIEQESGTMPLTVVSSPVNMGPGSAFDKGFRKVMETASEDDVVVTMEADNTSDLGIIDKMLAKFEEGADLVLASCYAEEGQVESTTLCRKVLSKGANILTSFVSKDKKIRTFSSFYRVYRAGLLMKAYGKWGDSFIEERGFVCAVEILLKLQKLNIMIEEVPMILRGSRRVGKSKMKTMRTILSYLRLIIKEVVYKSAQFFR